MRKNVFWMALISLAVMMSSAVFTSCSDDDDEKGGSLVGEWVYEDKYYFKFKEDGTWWTKKVDYDEDYDEDYSQEGTYVYKNGVVELSYLIPDEPIWWNKWKVIKLTASELAIEATGDEETYRMTLKRVK
jgi:hypothetical protein